jgi:division protein CdvB (Snf7/Vps24/ESCRT-III family)
MRDEPVISIKEARKILGDVADRMSDEELLETINTLDLLAIDALDDAKRKAQMKADARDLAELLYDIYQDKKRLDAFGGKIS